MVGAPGSPGVSPDAVAASQGTLGNYRFIVSGHIRLAQGGFGLGPGDHARGHELAPGRVREAQHERFADESGREQRLFDAGGVDLLAAGDDHAVGASGDPHAAIGRHVAPVAARPRIRHRAVGPDAESERRAGDGDDAFAGRREADSRQRRAAHGFT